MWQISTSCSMSAPQPRGKRGHRRWKDVSAGPRASTMTTNADADVPPGLTHVVDHGISTTEPGRSGSGRRVLRAWTRSAARFSASAAPEEVVWRGRTCSAIKQFVQRRLWVRTTVCSAGRLENRGASHCHMLFCALNYFRTVNMSIFYTLYTQ